MKTSASTTEHDVTKQAFTAVEGGALLKRVLGDGLISAVRARIVPLGMAAVRESMHRYGFAPERLTMTDEQAGVHFANEVGLDVFNRLVIRFFHEYKLEFLRTRLTADDIARSVFVEIGDSDGLVLKALGKDGLSINNDPRCVELIGRNGIRAQHGTGERLPVDDKSCDVAMSFETLEHSLNPLAFLQEMTRIAREKVVISIPGVTRTFVHPRIKGSRVGEEHVFEFCSADLVRLTTHLPLRLVHFGKMSVFAPPRSPLALAYYLGARGANLFLGCFRWFDFYVFDVDEADHGRTPAESTAVYFNRT